MGYMGISNSYCGGISNVFNKLSKTNTEVNSGKLNRLYIQFRRVKPRHWIDLLRDSMIEILAKAKTYGKRKYLKNPFRGLGGIKKGEKEYPSPLGVTIRIDRPAFPARPYLAW